MKNNLCQSRDPDIIASLPAMRRAARQARKLSQQMGTPFYVMKGGKIVDLNAKQPKTRKRPRPASAGVRKRKPAQ